MHVVDGALPRWQDLLDDLRAALVDSLETFGYRHRSYSGIPRALIDTVARQDDKLLELALILACWQERVAGHVPWDDDDLQSVTEVLETRSDEWNASRPALAGTLRAFVAAAETVL